MKNTKGVEMAIGPVAVIALVLIVLVVLAGFFLGGFGQGGGALSDAVGDTGSQASGLAGDTCTAQCVAQGFDTGTIDTTDDSCDCSNT